MKKLSLITAILISSSALADANCDHLIQGGMRDLVFRSTGASSYQEASERFMELFKQSNTENFNANGEYNDSTPLEKVVAVIGLSKETSLATYKLMMQEKHGIATSNSYDNYLSSTNSIALADAYNRCQELAKNGFHFDFQVSDNRKDITINISFTPQPAGPDSGKITGVKYKYLIATAPWLSTVEKKNQAVVINSKVGYLSLSLERAPAPANFMEDGRYVSYRAARVEIHTNASKSFILDLPAIPDPKRNPTPQDLELATYKKQEFQVIEGDLTLHWNDLSAAEKSRFGTDGYKSLDNRRVDLTGKGCTRLIKAVAYPIEGAYKQKDNPAPSRGSILNESNMGFTVSVDTVRFDKQIIHWVAVCMKQN